MSQKVKSMEKQIPEDSGCNEHSGRILVVDDNLANIDVMLTFLEMQGYQVSIATNGEMALRIAKHNQPDLILLDVMMPDIDGYETCRRLKADQSTSATPVIFVTAKKETADIVEGFRCGGVDYISKPFRQEEVLSRVNTHLQLRQMAKTQDSLIRRLNKTLAEVKSLKGILPICSYCKKIKDGDGNWHKLETFIRNRSEAEFTHCVCQTCLATFDENGNRTSSNHGFNEEKKHPSLKKMPNRKQF